MHLANAEDTPSVPHHVAIIMDGNGRWATQHGVPRMRGHQKGAEAVRRTVRAAAEMGIAHLTLFGFSSENWRRPQGEVNDLMGLLRLYLRNEVAELHKNGVCIDVIGNRAKLPQDIQNLIADVEAQTRSNSRIRVTIALSYGGREEIVEAAKSLAADALAGDLDVQAIDEELFEQHLYTSKTPDPDLLIRTSGEQRISNFLLWQCAYAEFVFTDTLWPDFDKDDLSAAIDEFQRRDRRFGVRAQSA